MKTLRILLTIALLCICHSTSSLTDDVDKVDGGIGIHISNDLFDTLKIDILEQGFEMLKNLGISGVSVDKNLLGLIQLKGDIQNISIVDIGCDKEKSTIRFSNGFPNILFQLIDLHLLVKFDYSLLTEPEIYKDVGNAIINIAPFSLSLGMTLNNNNGALSIETQSVSYYFDDYSIEFTGNGDVSFLLMSIAEVMKPILQADLSPNIEGLLEGLVFPQVNTLLESLGDTMELEGFILDYQIMDYPPFTEYDFGLVLKGEVRTVNGDPPPFQKDRQVPKNGIKDGGFIQAFLSDYVIRSLLYAVYESEILAIKYDDNPLNGGKLTVGLVKYLIIDLQKKYSDDTIVFFELNTMDTPIPEFYIKGGETYMSLQVNLYIGVTTEEGKDIKIALTTIQIDLTLNFGLEDGTKIAASISSFYFSTVGDVTNYDPDIIVDTQDFNATIGLVPGIARNFVNHALDAIDIPIPDLPIVSLDLNKTYIIENDGYLTFKTSPRISFKDAKALKRIPPPFNKEKSFRNQLNTREAKVEFVKRLVKMTPIMTVLDEARRQKSVTKFNPGIFGLSYGKAQDSFTPKCDLEDSGNAKNLKQHTS